MEIILEELNIVDSVQDRYKTVYPPSEGMALVQGFNKLYGFVNNETGELQIPCIYPYAESFSEGKALVRDKNHNFKYINDKGIVVVGRLNVTHASSYHNNRAKVRYGSSNYYIDEFGNIIGDRSFSSLSDYSEGLALVLPYNQDMFSSRKSVIDLDGKVVFSLPKGCSFASYDCVFYGGYVPITIVQYDTAKNERRTYGSTRIKITEVKGFADRTGNIISDPKKVKEIEKIYELAKEKATRTSEKPVSHEKLVYYSSTISYPGGNITLKADTPEELVLKKEKFLALLSEAINELSEQVKLASGNLRQRKKDNE